MNTVSIVDQFIPTEQNFITRFKYFEREHRTARQHQRLMQAYRELQDTSQQVEKLWDMCVTRFTPPEKLPVYPHTDRDGHEIVFRSTPQLPITVVNDMEAPFLEDEEDDYDGTNTFAINDELEALLGTKHIAEPIGTDFWRDYFQDMREQAFEGIMDIDANRAMYQSYALAWLATMRLPVRWSKKLNRMSIDGLWLNTMIQYFNEDIDELPAQMLEDLDQIFAAINYSGRKAFYPRQVWGKPFAVSLSRKLKDTLRSMRYHSQIIEDPEELRELKTKESPLLDGQQKPVDLSLGIRHSEWRHQFPATNNIGTLNPVQQLFQMEGQEFGSFLRLRSKTFPRFEIGELNNPTKYKVMIPTIRERLENTKQPGGAPKKVLLFKGMRFDADTRKEAAQPAHWYRKQIVQVNDLETQARALLLAMWHDYAHGTKYEDALVRLYLQKYDHAQSILYIARRAWRMQPFGDDQLFVDRYKKEVGIKRDMRWGMYYGQNIDPRPKTKILSYEQENELFGYPQGTRSKKFPVLNWREAYPFKVPSRTGRWNAGAKQVQACLTFAYITTRSYTM